MLIFGVQSLPILWFWIWFDLSNCATNTQKNLLTFLPCLLELRATICTFHNWKGASTFLKEIKKSQWLIFRCIRMQTSDLRGRKTGETNQNIVHKYASLRSSYPANDWNTATQRKEQSVKSSTYCCQYCLIRSHGRSEACAGCSLVNCSVYG